jgi:NOL1/NOP2/fmu family ribosome biogenesis protein
MIELKILNSKEIKEIHKLIETQWGAKLKLDYGFLKNTKNKVFVVNKDISKIDYSKLRINSVGMYFCELNKRGIRLSIEGTQIVGPHAKKNIVDINDTEVKQWLKGEDFEKECKGSKGFVILRHNGDFVGNANYAKGQLLNYVNKARRISTKQLF